MSLSTLESANDDSSVLTARRQSALGWAFAGAVLAMFLGYVLLMVLAQPLLARRIASSSSISIAVVLGYLMLFLIMMLTALYLFVRGRSRSGQSERAWTS